MIKTFLNCIILILSLQVTAQWSTIPSGTNSNLRAVHFPTDSIGYIAGDYGTILKTTDQGNTWATVHIDSALSFNSVYFTGAAIGYATAGNLFKTTDGGVNWTLILTNSLNSISEVYFVNDSLGFASEEGTLHKTTNAGATWTIALTGAVFSSIFFPSENVGYFIGGPDYSDELYKTTDSGQSFILITNGFQSIKEATYFLNDTVGYMCGWYNPMLEKTVDGGITWQSVNSSNSLQCWDVYFRNENIGYYMDNSGGTYLIYNTGDGGLTWTVQLNASSMLSEFFFITPTVGVAIGDLGSIYKTTNGGVNGVGIEVVDKISIFEISPNPTKGDFSIDLGEIHQFVKLSITDISGKVIMTETFKNSQLLNLQLEEPAGVYMIVIESKNKREVHRLVKE